MGKIGYIFISCVTLCCACKKNPPAPLPSANFLVTNTGATAPCSLYFYDASQNAVKWNWKFGNGQTSSKQNDTIPFNTAGTFETWLEIWNLDGVKDSIRKTITVN